MTVQTCIRCQRQLPWPDEDWWEDQRVPTCWYCNQEPAIEDDERWQINATLLLLIAWLMVLIIAAVFVK